MMRLTKFYRKELWAGPLRGATLSSTDWALHQPTFQRFFDGREQLVTGEWFREHLGPPPGDVLIAQSCGSTHNVEHTLTGPALTARADECGSIDVAHVHVDDDQVNPAGGDQPQHLHSFVGAVRLEASKPFG
jgi:hypothetical protein